MLSNISKRTVSFYQGATSCGFNKPVRYNLEKKA